MRILPFLLWTVSLLGAEPLVLVVNPASPVRTLSVAEAASLIKGESLFLAGKKVLLVLTKPSGPSLPAVCFGLIQTSPAKYFALVKQARMRGVLLDPQFLDSPGALEAAVAANPQAVGFLLKREAAGTGTRLVSIHP